LTAAKTELVSRVDRCTAALVEPHATLITELSGGLDSSIVAAALGETGFAGRVAQWLNRYGDRAEGDERDFARLVTDRLGVALTTTRKPLTPLDQAGLAETATGLWPAINSVDAGRDVDTVCRLDETGASGIISGDGGDAVFFQMPTPLVWADELRRRGLAALTSPLLADVARRTHLSVWSVIGRAWAEHRGRAPPDMTPSPFVTSEVRDGYAKAAHPWVRDALRQGVPPAKCLQVVALANSQLFLGPSRRTAQADLLFPLLSQPVMEFCLSIAAPDLASGSFDRPFARAAFAGRLPEGVLARRAKGNLTAYFARLVAASADWLAPYLLDGCLCDAGVLDRTAVASALQPDQILWTTEASGLLTVAAVEAWVRHWQGRAPDSAAASRHRLQP
jgi:asparagine synthase (glutamine-hydrolysing)